MSTKRANIGTDDNVNNLNLNLPGVHVPPPKDQLQLLPQFSGDIHNDIFRWIQRLELISSKYS
jgi:hypothetical protein